MENLTIKNFGPIASANIDFGDLTLFVGPQASGKSILLQLLKLIIDKDSIPAILDLNNYEWGKSKNKLLELYFGEAMSFIWTEKTEIRFNDEIFDIGTVTNEILPSGKKSIKEQLFYVPAQRVVTMSQGWPRAFSTFDIGDPFVLKQFSETVRTLMEKETSKILGSDGQVFPKPGRIKEPLRNMLDESIFHGGEIISDEDSLKKRFVMNVAGSRLPFMTWSAGQKEFMPLLLSFYHLIPSTKASLRDNIKWVIIEEPEMGLHPRAIESIMVVFLELLARGYKVIVSTHTPVLLELAWAIKYVKEYNGSASDLFDLFSLSPNASLQKVFDTVIANKTFNTYYFDLGKNGAVVKDISSLDAGSEDASISNWGGLSEFGGKASDIISRLVANAV
ncbi:MAG: AAA family ATPase [Terrimonas sp.]|nr:AAA family ATPase [Terrimonas sp.]MBN8857092.1 AAA family ATPase [Sphingobacteriales bacterium]